MEFSRLWMGIIAPFLVISYVLAGSGNETDKHSLLEFKSKIEHDPFGLFKSWNDSVHFCSWPGVACSQRHRQRVTALNLPSLKLKGRLSPHIGNLSFLRRLNLENNSFSHGIPREIGRLFRLRVIRFSNNSFGSEIPANLSGCTSLRVLNMINNNFSGGIPKEIGSLSELRTLGLGDDNLVGEIPASIGNLSFLGQLYLRRTSLQGTIPVSLHRLQRLEILALQQNNLTGTIPVALFNISSIRVFSLIGNKLVGNLPPYLGLTLPKLEFFSVGTNHMSGSIPATVSNSSNLDVFDINDNGFTGKIPSFGSSLNLRVLGLAYNNLGFSENGELNFIHDLVNCTRLEELAIASNNLGGEIPETIGNMTSRRLRRLVFGRNQIKGKIPTGIGNLVSLDTLGLEANNLTGHIPSTIGKLNNMISLNLRTNHLSGTIPPSIRNLTRLISLLLDRNNLQGTVPPSLGDCRNLQLLSLARNNLIGPIPSTVFSLPSLSRLLNLSGNQFTGLIPVDVGKLVNLGQLDISENKISGEIPKALGGCTSIEYLNLQGNMLRGSIPAELSALRGVQVIDISRNNLSGQVPMYFGDFRGLQFLNFSFNEFEGPVPLQGIFKNASKFSIIGNSRLCGGLPELKLPVCTSFLQKSRELSAKRRLLVIVIICSAIVGIAVLLFLAMLMLRSRKRGTLVTEPSSRSSLPRVSYEDLFNSTGGFASENVIGVGSFGSVYKGTLDQEKRHVAVKVLNLDILSALKSFIVECESLGSIKHRNIVKLITVCSSIDFRGNDFKALVYEYMENENLDQWLHRGTEQSRHLNLIQRIDIAIDVASALDYLHNHCSEPIAHCDIKPSNILLDGQMVAHVGDFGLAKLVKSAFPSANNQSSSTGIRGTVGYVAPEYATGNEVSTLGDIYSYGILLLELVSGKRPTDGMFKDDFDLHNFASLALHEEKVHEIVDPKLLKGEEEGQRIGNGTRSLDDKAPKLNECLVLIIEIGVSCSSKSPEKRKNMGDVAAELHGIRNLLRRTHNG